MANSYQEAGVNYDQLDALKRFAQMAARETDGNLPPGISGVADSRGESAFVIDVGPFYLATVQEGLGTKNLIAEALGTPEETHFDKIGRDTVAMIVNDLITVGARPLWVNAHWAFGSSQFLEGNPEKGPDLARGWAAACNEAGAVYAAGETPILKGIIYPETVELSGSGVGIIEPKSRLTLGDRLQAGDHIVLIESNGIHANGLTLVRDVAAMLPDGYQTRLSDGQTFGETILNPTHVYVKLQQEVFAHGLDVHYMVHITGHGWRKLMRANRDFTYRMFTVPDPQEEFGLMQQTGGISDEEMYNTFNMGTGFAFMLSAKQTQYVVAIAKQQGLKAWDAGVLEKGPKQVVIEPKGITYKAETLQIR